MISRRFFLLLGGLMMAASLSAAPPASLEKNGVLRYAVGSDGTIPTPVYTAPGHCAWPKLTLMPDGQTLAVLIFNGAGHASVPGDVECWLSRDGGTTWKFASAATQHVPGTVRVNHAAGLTASGELIVITSGWADWPPGVPRTRGRFRHAVLAPWVSRSPNGGLSWWVDKEGFPRTTPGGQSATAFGKVEIALNGDLCVAVSGPEAPWERFAERRFRSYLYRSKDDGRTWGDPVVVGANANETDVLHLGDGRWLAAARTGTGVEGKDAVDLYASDDDGRIWTLQRTMTGYQQVNGHLAKLRDGRVLFSYGDRASPPGKKGIEAMISADRGKTWSRPIRVVDWNGGDGGYPSSVQRKDGQVVTAYYCSALPGDPPNSYRNYHMGVVIWDPERSFREGDER